MQVLDDTGRGYTLGKDNRLKTSSQARPKRRVRVLTPRWASHDMITCAGVMPSLQAISFTWEHAQ